MFCNMIALLFYMMLVLTYFPFILNMIRDGFEIRYPSSQSSSICIISKIKSLHVEIDYAGDGRELGKDILFWIP